MKMNAAQRARKFATSVLGLGSSLVVICAINSATAELPAIHAGVHPTPAVVTQVLKHFDNPEGAVFSADGKFVFISNSAEIGDRGAGFSWTENEG